MCVDCQVGDQEHLLNGVFIMLENILIPISFSIMTMFLWFDTNVFYEYGSKIPFLKRIFHAYDRNKSHYDNCRYSEFLMIYYNNFVSKLLSCPYCFGFWSILLFTFAFSSPEFIAINYLLSIMSYFAYSFALEKMNATD